MAKGIRRLSALLLVLTVGAGTVTCAAMTWTPVAPAHPCCPHSQNPDSNRCAKIGCIGTAPVLVPNAAQSVAPVLVFAMVQHQPATEGPSPERAIDPVPHLPEFTLFLAHHQLLI